MFRVAGSTCAQSASTDDTEGLESLKRAEERTGPVGVRADHACARSY